MSTQEFPPRNSKKICDYLWQSEKDLNVMLAETEKQALFIRMQLVWTKSALVEMGAQKNETRH